MPEDDYPPKLVHIGPLRPEPEPIRQRSELRQALDAVHGSWTPDLVFDPPSKPPARFRPWLGSLGTLTLAGVLAALIAAGVLAVVAHLF